MMSCLLSHGFEQSRIHRQWILLLAVQERVKPRQIWIFSQTHYVWPTSSGTAVAGMLEGGLDADSFIARSSACTSPSSLSTFKRGLRLILVDQAHGEANMHQYPVADTLVERMVIVNHTLQAHFSLDAANIDERHLPLNVGDLYYLTRDSKTHCLLLN